MHHNRIKMLTEHQIKPHKFQIKFTKHQKEPHKYQIKFYTLSLPSIQ